MKTLILILISTTAFVAQTFSPDTLYLNSGNVIIGKVQEISDNLIKYKKPERMDGPLYDLNKSEVSSIHYSNGTQDIFSNETSASVASNTVAVHVAGKDDQVIPTAQTTNTGIYGNSYGSNQIINAAVIGAGVLAAGNFNHGGYYRRRSCYNPGYRRGGNAALAVPIVIGLASLVTHLR